VSYLFSFIASEDAPKEVEICEECFEWKQGLKAEERGGQGADGGREKEAEEERRLIWMTGKMLERGERLRREKFGEFASME